MPDERKYYVLCSANCKFESMTKEQILSAITQAVENGTVSDVDTGFVTMLKEQNAKTGLRFWVGTQAEYNAINAAGNVPSDCFCIITDDTTADDINAHFTGLEQHISQVQSFATQRIWLSQNLGLNKTLWSGAAYFTRDAEPLDVVGVGDYRLFAITADLQQDGTQTTVLVYATEADGYLTLEYNGNYDVMGVPTNFYFFAQYFPNDPDKLKVTSCRAKSVDGSYAADAMLYRITGVL